MSNLPKLKSHPNSFQSAATLTSGANTVHLFRLKALAEQGVDLPRLPFSLRILLENLLRHEDGRTVTAEDIRFLAAWDPKAEPSREIAYMPTPTISTRRSSSSATANATPSSSGAKPPSTTSPLSHPAWASVTRSTLSI
jgi:aconitase A